MKLTIAAMRLEALGVGQMGASIFINSMPAEIPQGILLRDTDHGSPINPYLPGYIASSFRVAVRAADFQAGFTLAWRALDALTIPGEVTIGPGLVKLMQPQNEPRPYRRSAGGLWEFEIDVSVNYCRALVSSPPVP